MANFSWLEQRAELSEAALTVRVQTISATDDGSIKYESFAPTQDVNSTKVSEILTTDWRPTADRRGWNLRGRHVQIKTPDLADIEWVPIETYFKIEEKEINDLLNASAGNQQQFQDRIGAGIPARTDLLAQANFRRADVDWFTAWALNQISVKNPETGTTTTVALGMAASRYTTAGVAWNDVSINGYDAFLTWLAAAEVLTGPAAGVMMRLATFNAIRVDAPASIFPGMTALARLTRAQVADAVSEELGRPFDFIINEQTHDIFTDAGSDTTRVAVWPAQRVAVIPVGGRVGTTYRAPVARAWALANAAPDAGIDVRGNSVFNEIGGNGRDLTVECQINLLGVPDESKVAVVNAGV